MQAPVLSVFFAAFYGAGRSGNEDRELLAQVARSDGAALRQLYDRYGGRVMAVAQRILTSRSEAEEIVQEAFVDVWYRATQFDPTRGSAESWILAIARNRAIDRLRSRASQTRVRSEAAREVDASPQAATPLESAAERETRKRVEKALAELPAEQRRVVELAFWRGLSQSEIAAETGDPLGTVKGRARAALEKLARLLPEGSDA
jgi:RNA polymerase sigma-70 factor (ECF subfamily)